ncbi:MAG TPA: transposase [Solirubrobacteraceae bacterium]|nr:transposase [Solirubrobacteraceae bacterium]
MAKDFRPVDRGQQFLLPPDMAEWLPADHLAWFVIAVVDELDMSAFKARRKLGGAGRAAFDPRMLLALLVYAYACGQRSSRQIERLCATDVAFRVICAQDVPDHATIARFRAEHRAGVEELFTQVLVLCARAGLARLGVVAVDGTKIAANASIAADRSRAWLRGQAAAMLEEAERVDAEEDALFGSARGDELPEQFADPRTRKARIKAALERLREADAAEDAQAEAEMACWSARLDAAAAALAKAEAAAQGRLDIHRRKAADAAAGVGRKPQGKLPVPVEGHCRVRAARGRLARVVAEREQARLRLLEARAAREQDTKVNLTDADSRRMPTKKGWIHGYNAQLAVSDDQIILAAALTQQPSDVQAFIPMTRAAEAAVRALGEATGAELAIGVVLADAGYLSAANLTAPGPDRLIALGKNRQLQADARDRPAAGPPPPGADPLTAMGHRLRTPEGIATYKRRAATVEPVNGHLKDRIGLRRFSLRGKEKAQTELTLAAAVANLLKLHRHTWAPA